jgi:hypothetical protein
MLGLRLLGVSMVTSAFLMPLATLVALPQRCRRRVRCQRLQCATLLCRCGLAACYLQQSWICVAVGRHACGSPGARPEAWSLSCQRADLDGTHVKASCARVDLV